MGHLILQAGETRRDVAQRARDQLQAADAPILGAVLNNVDFEKDKYYYYTYYRYYNKYYGDDKKRKRGSAGIRSISSGERKTAS